MTTRRERFVEWCLKMIEPLPRGPNGEEERFFYRWAGKGPDRFDCSGFVTYGLHHVGGPDLRETHWSGRLWRELPPVKTPKPGDLCFYGPPGSINHVMVWMGDGSVIGASGGNSETTNDIVARARNAYVKRRVPHTYRAGFKGFRRFEPLDKEQGNA